MTDQESPVKQSMLADALLLPRVLWLVARRPRDVHRGWNEYWAAVRTTGDGGDVLWDATAAAEMAGYRETVETQLDRSMPIVDVGCGNGRFTRWLADISPTVLGVDLSPFAIARAELESAHHPSVRFRALDATAPDAGAKLHAEFGDVNIFVRGVFHVLEPAGRRALANNLLAMAGTSGRVILTETDYRGSALGYLQLLGAKGWRIPAPLERAMVSLPQPGHFGPAEKELAFPFSDWRTVSEGPTTILTVPMSVSNPIGAIRGNQPKGRAGSPGPHQIPGYLAVLEPRPERNPGEPDDGERRLTNTAT